MAQQVSAVQVADDGEIYISFVERENGVYRAFNLTPIQLAKIQYETTAILWQKFKPVPRD